MATPCRYICALALSALAAAAPPALEDLVEGTGTATLVLHGIREDNGAPVQSSGCYVSQDGHVLTTAHQIVGVGQLQARTQSGDHPALEVLEVDPARELALLKATRPTAQAVPIGNSNALKSGAFLFSIAAPRGLEFTTVTGIVSKTDMTYRGHPAFLADLRTGPGSSGGPIFNERGELVGLVIGKLENEEWLTVVKPVNTAFPMLRRHGVFLEPGAIGGQGTVALAPAPGLSPAELRAVQAYNKGVDAKEPADKAKAYRLAVKVLPDFYEAWFNLGISATALEEFDEAEHAYRQARALNPGALKTQRNLGRLYLKQSKRKEALACFKQASILAPADAQSYNDLGEAHRQLAQHPQAIQAFSKAIELRPGYAQAHFNLGLSEANGGDPRAAASHFETYLRLRPQARDAAQVQAWIKELRGKT